jgi:hypothetical protein
VFDSDQDVKKSMNNERIPKNSSVLVNLNKL